MEPISLSSPADAERERLVHASWPADLATPVGLFLALRARGHRVCLLESAAGPGRLARYSFVGVDPRASYRGGPRGNVLRTAEGERTLPGAAHEGLREAARLCPPARPPAGLPPFCGGWVGWFAHEWITGLEPSVPRAALDPWGLPDACFDLYEDVFAVDHAAQRLHAVCAAPRGAADHASARARLLALAEDALAPAPPNAPLVLAGELVSRMERARFEDGVRSLREAIRTGECFQAVLSHRFEIGAEGDAFALYRVLRLANPSPHMFFFETEELTLVGSSPERLVAVQGGRAETRPIAGTRPRGHDELEDERLAAELRASAKERSEHDMLVDLARNDLGRVARTGTVRVREHAALERFARVQHLSSRVTCELASGFDALDALAACFPAGTVSGAPKLRALQLVAALEGETRGPYAGAFGYLDGDGNLDTAIVIRSFVLRNGLLSLQAGAGIVFDSDPAAEYDETCHKARALIEAARMVDAPAFGGPGRGELRP